MAALAKFLDLSPSFGGQPFGPFRGSAIRLGSDGDRCHITIPATLGAAPVHLQVLEEGPDHHLLAPVDASAAVYLFRQGQGAGIRVTGPTAIVGGDSFSIASPEGPRFTLRIVHEEPIAGSGPDPAEAGGSWQTGRGIAEEIGRRGFAAAVTTRLGHTAMRVWAFLRTGQFLQPVYLVSGLVLLSGWLLGGAALFGAWRTSVAQSSSGAALADCRDQLAVARATRSDRDPTVPELVGRVLDVPTLAGSLDSDIALREAYLDQMAVVRADPTASSWLYTDDRSSFAELRTALLTAGLPAPLVRTLAFTAAHAPDRAWHVVRDSDGHEVCGRGPLALTYRHAAGLGLRARPDALVSAALARGGDLPAQRQALAETLARAGAAETLGGGEIVVRGADIQGGRQCMHLDGPDERSDVRALAQALARHVGPAAPGFPPEGRSQWVVARLAGLHALEFGGVDHEATTFDGRTPISVRLQALGVGPTRAEYALAGAARALAWAAGSACQARISRGADGIPPWFLDLTPRLGDCAVLAAYVAENR